MRFINPMLTIALVIDLLTRNSMGNVIMYKTPPKLARIVILLIVHGNRSTLLLLAIVVMTS